MGIDFQSRNVMYANNMARKYNLTYFTYHATIQSIFKDDWIPNKSFDYVFSNAVLMYLNKKTACSVISKSIQILKVGGIAWFSWNDKIYGLKMCLLNYMRNENNTVINHWWLNGTTFLDSCAKEPSRPSLIIKRID